MDALNETTVKNEYVEQSIVIAIAIVIVYFFIKILLKYEWYLVQSLSSLTSGILQIPYTWNVLWWFRSNDIHDCVRMAQSKTGLYDFGDDDCNNGSMILKYDISRKVGQSVSKAQYTIIGYLFVRRILTNRLSIHLRLIDYIKRHPCILNIPVKKPIFIIGFPRTGTTFLHELLGLHAGVKSHCTWHQMSPVPNTNNIHSFQSLSNDLLQRYHDNKYFFNFMLKLLTLIGDSSINNIMSSNNNSTSICSSNTINNNNSISSSSSSSSSSRSSSNNIQKVHRIGYDETEECTTPCGMGLPWALTEIPFIPFATKDIIHLGAGNAYKNYKKFLQLMSCQLYDCSDIMNPPTNTIHNNHHNSSHNINHSTNNNNYNNNKNNSHNTNSSNYSNNNNHHDPNNHHNKNNDEIDSLIHNNQSVNNNSNNNNSNYNSDNDNNNNNSNTNNNDNNNNNNRNNNSNDSNNHTNIAGISLPWSWMLKCPFHLPYLTDLFTTFPDAVIIWTHRHPVECIASACSLYETMSNMASVNMDRYALGIAVMEYTMLCLNKAEESLKEIGEEFTLKSSTPSSSSSSSLSDIKIIHVRYQDTINDPKSVCQTIIQQMDMIYSQEYDVLINNYLIKNSQDRKNLLHRTKQDASSKDCRHHHHHHKNNSSNDNKKEEEEEVIHEYNLADYGLNEKDINYIFRNYIKAFEL